MVRYLFTLVIAFNSARDMIALSDRVGHSTDIRMDLVILNLQLPTVTSKDIQELEAKTINMLPAEPKNDRHRRDRSAVADFFLKFGERHPDLKAVNDRAMVHAEAALMGVAYGIASGYLRDGTVEAVTGVVCVGSNWICPTLMCSSAVVQTESIPIGVSQKCCRCCAMLHELLELWRQRQEPAYSGRYPKLVLPGTHTSFVPWIPPIGIPLEVLKDLRKRLAGLLIAVARKGFQLKSNQTSLAMTNMYPAERLTHAQLPPLTKDMYATQ